MADLLPLNPDELLTTTRAVRKRLDLTRPVERSVVERCIEIAMQARIMLTHPTALACSSFRIPVSRSG